LGPTVSFPAMEHLHRRISLLKVPKLTYKDIYLSSFAIKQRYILKDTFVYETSVSPFLLPYSVSLTKKQIAFFNICVFGSCRWILWLGGMGFFLTAYQIEILQISKFSNCLCTFESNCGYKSP